MKEKRTELLEIRHLCYAYEEDKPVLQDISLSIAEGERIAVLGANGAGKSTFFLNLNGVRTPESGEIWYRGTQVKRKDKRKLQEKIGIVFQEADNQIIASTVRAEVAFGPANLKLPREEIESRTREALEEMKLEAYGNRPPHYLSGGEKKRVTIADILAMKPEIIIFDEPTASLDPANAEMLEEVLGKLQSQGKTILLSTHDVDFAYRFAQRLLIFAEGKLIGDGSPRELFSKVELLHQANLKKPVLMRVEELLYRKGILKEMTGTVRRLEDLESMLEEIR